LFHILIIPSDLVRWFIATQSENQKLWKDRYIISINFSVVLFQCRTSAIELSQYLSNKDELRQQGWRWREKIQGFQNLSKDGRQTDWQIEMVSRILIMKIPVQIIFMYCVIRCLELLMEYAEVHQQQET